ncbi:flagellar motor protein MotB [Oleisolibacter albus]|uniref:flagellar motor protein MotB n=1 Tax=Oleisolibacter albus TaxID=2171757 RepID=UPI000DF3E29F|nr:flagellar motor protein MotB [Oleisolibacter albus]
MASGGAGGEEKAPIIIKKVYKGGEGHHGGAWKVAYADFVTAMMAFFLLLWLLNVTTAEQKMGIADYFAPASASKQESGAGGVMGGRTMTAPGAMMNDSSPVSPAMPVPSVPPGGSEEEEKDESPSTGKGAPTEASDGKGYGPDGGGLSILERAGATKSADANHDGKIDEKELKEALAKLEQEQFQQAAQELRQAIQSVPELRDLAQNLIIDQTREGLRIQLVDQEGYSMFPGGSAKMFPQTAQLLSLVSQAVGKLPNRLSVSGHTDSSPYPPGSSYTNWELSTDRANASRRALEATGIDPKRFETVVGRADRDPLFPTDPKSPRNRRISIVLLRGQPVPDAPAAGQAVPGAAVPQTAPQSGAQTGPSSAPTRPAPLPPLPGPTTTR